MFILANAADIRPVIFLLILLPASRSISSSMSVDRMLSGAFCFLKRSKCKQERTRLEERLQEEQGADHRDFGAC